MRLTSPIKRPHEKEAEKRRRRLCKRARPQKNQVKIGARLKPKKHSEAIFSAVVSLFLRFEAAAVAAAVAARLLYAPVFVLFVLRLAPITRVVASTRKANCKIFVIEARAIILKKLVRQSPKVATTRIGIQVENASVVGLKHAYFCWCCFQF